ncbi:MAG: alkaline phosphatase family protein [Candidatus Eisenbacteria bacterium]|nr:alkaline phosphatase family protein [Candidatus Eisenbacteria bacterium]
MKVCRIAAALALALSCGCAPRAATHRPVVVLGIDGMDPQLLERFVARGVMPHFEALMKSGSYSRLGTSIPPQSPVAWSCFITGMDPGGHGIFDFIHRDPATYLPVFSAARVTEPGRTLTLGDWAIPLSGGKAELQRKGEAFWQVLDRHHVPCEVLRIPANFPPAPSRGRTLAGMGVPDLLGSYGTFSFYTDADLGPGAEVPGGALHRVRVVDGRVRAELIGPENTLRRGRPELKRPFTVDLDAGHGTARITVGDEVRLLATGQWSDWVPVKFDLAGRFKRLSGICRFYLRSVRPTFRLYVSPINLDPEHPALPISTPPGFSRELFDRIGYFYTQGMPEDTKAFEAGVLDDTAYVAQTDTVLAEGWRMLDTALADYRNGFLFFYVSTLDQSGHMLWRNFDDRHPAHARDLAFGERYQDLYVRMDSLLGVVRGRIPGDATLIVMSDHGFAPYHKKFHLNTWLYEQGYLVLERPGEKERHPLLRDVLWRRTRAYALGLNGLYVNLLGREKKGIVRPSAEYDGLLDDLSRKLLALRDPETGEQVVTRVYRARDVYHGPEVAAAPDLIVGYNRGYRGSDESALGSFTPSWLTPNLAKWSGDHCMDHTLVPGVLLANRPIAVADPTLLDLPVTILDLYGIAKPARMSGRVLFTR